MKHKFNNTHTSVKILIFFIIVAANGLSFDIVLEEENGNDNSLNKQPPKRLQRLEEQSTSPITLNKLQEKLDEAEVRRQQVIFSSLLVFSYCRNCFNNTIYLY